MKAHVLAVVLVTAPNLGFAATGDSVSPLDYQLNHLKDQPRLVTDDMQKAKEGQAPRQHLSKFRYAGIDSHKAHLSTLDNEAVTHKRFNTGINTVKPPKLK